MSLSRRRKPGLRGDRGWAPALILRRPPYAWLLCGPASSSMLLDANFIPKNIYVVEKRQIKKVGL